VIAAERAGISSSNRPDVAFFSRYHFFLYIIRVDLHSGGGGDLITRPMKQASAAFCGCYDTELARRQRAFQRRPPIWNRASSEELSCTASALSVKGFKSGFS